MNRPCPEPEELLHLLDGEVTENRSSQLRSHMTNCRQCAQELEAQKQLTMRLAAPVDGVPSPGAVQAVLRRIDSNAAPKPRAVVRWIPALCAGGLAAVAAVTLMVLPRGANERGEFRARGATVAWTNKVGIEIWALGTAPRKLAAGARVTQGTALVASYSNIDTAAANLLAFGFDGRGEVHSLYPGYGDSRTDPLTVRLEPLHIQQTLPDAVALDDVPVGPLRIVWIISRGPLHVSSIEALLAGDRTLEALRARFPGTRVGELLLHVESSSQPQP